MPNLHIVSLCIVNSLNHFSSQKDVENEIAKPADALLDKVFRYFQEGGDSALNCGELTAENPNNVCVPKQSRKLEVQPEFIPL